MATQISKILIANRAEIATRILKTCFIRGIEAVTLYTEGEETLPHITQSKEAVLLEGEQLSDTYLNTSKLIEIAKNTGCDAIHPGYGFLSENAAFAKAVREAGLIFIGPSAEVIDLMGDKKRARDIAEKAGVPLVPGFSPHEMELKQAGQMAAEIGYPVMIKATAGGGGKGMRIVHEPAEFETALRQASAEAQSSFGHAEVLVEKYLEEPRHIEVQVIADQKGHVLHLFERDCSVQRRHQKVVEESPAFGVKSASYQVLFDTAVALCRQVGYTNAGTIEFIMDKHQNVYFLEMNTRLQVEHPVTEQVCGLDLVSLQIDVAEGKSLPYQQADIRQKGHAIELRLYAEDPMNNYLPTSGLLEDFQFPNWPGVRIDTGYSQGTTVSNRFDPMIAKIIVSDHNRQACLERASAYLAQCQVAGFVTNLGLLKRILQDDTFRSEAVTTHYLNDHSELTTPFEPNDQQQLAMVGAALFSRSSSSRSSKTSLPSQGGLSAWQRQMVEGFRNV